MKTRFNSFDIVCSVTELQRLIGMRVNNVYDVDNKTYLIRLQRSEEKSVLLFESGNKIHTTNFEWPKNIAPSGFSMKMRKHLKNKRLESLNQLGTDRIIDLQFGSGEAAYHIILELYDRGNIILTDHELTILNVLRPHTEGDKVKFAVREKYPTDRARKSEEISSEQIKSILGSAKQGDSLKKVLLPHLDYGPALIEHALMSKGFNNSVKIGKNFNIEEDLSRLMEAIQIAEEILTKAKINPSKGYILQKKEERPKPDSTSETEYFYSNQEFNPFLFIQHSDQPYKEFETFNLAVDEFFSGLESQKIEMRALQQEREAMKKLENVRKDHSQRLMALERTQETDKQKAELITRNQELVDNAILAIHAALANQLSWPDIEKLVEEATNRGDPIASCIKKLKLEINTISLYLKDPYEESSSDGSEKDVEDEEKLQPMIVDINLDYTAFANARNYYDQKRSAAKKQQKTIESQSKALKSAEKKTKQTLKEVQTITSINKARKVYWFEKFFWFISSENYLVIAGRDQQQNELIVKRYMKPTDIYVHADIHGASSVVIKNPTGQPVPPKTLNEAGTMAICYSVAWEAKVVTNAYWVQGDQVSKTAPTGEYLTTGSFMIRGKKNFLPPCHLVLGLSFLFRLEDGCVEKHRGERKVIAAAEETAAAEDEEQKEEEEIDLEGGGSDVDEEKGGLGDIKEDEEEAEEFPDTHIKIDYSEGAKVNVVADSRLKIESDEESEKVVYLGDDKPVVIKTNQRSRGVSETSTKSKINEKIESKQEDSKHNQQQPKRGQKGKLKKMKEKYKDQDEEERKLRMDILQSAGSGKDTKKNKKNKDAQGNKGNKKTVFKLPKPQIQKPEEDEEEETLVQADTDMIDALTGIPAPEDELLFAVPVVAPYNTLANYKYKVKLTPGTGRRGKAAKTAVAIFIKDRSASQREKDLLKAVKDEQLARNIPGKVKLSAAKLHKK